MATLVLSALLAIVICFVMALCTCATVALVCKSRTGCSDQQRILQGCVYGMVPALLVPYPVPTDARRQTTRRVWRK